MYCTRIYCYNYQ